MIITSIKQQKKNPGRVSIFLDGEFAFGLENKFLVDYDLYKKKELRQDLIDEIIRKDTGEKVKKRVIRLIARRPRSEKEVRDYIWRKFYDGKLDVEKKYCEELIENVIKDLKKLDLVNDEKFAEWFVSNRKNFKPRGKILLKKELYEKGVSRKIITRVLSFDKDESLEMARRLVEKKKPKLSHFDDKKAHEKLIRFLQRKGFCWDIIKKVI